MKYRVNEVCHATGLSRKTIYRKMSDGSLTYSVEKGKRYIEEAALKALAKSKKPMTVHEDKVCHVCVGLRDEVTRLRLEIERLATAVETLTQENDTKKGNTEAPIGRPQLKNSTSPTGDNAKRSEEAKKRLFSALDSMKEIPLYRGKPSITGIYKATGIDRGTISKYLSEYTFK